MPVSLRIPPNIEIQIADYATRQGLTKSAVIMRSLNEFLARHTKPSAYQIYLDVMLQEAASPRVEPGVQESRPHKIASRQAMLRKHAERSARAGRAPKAKSAPRKAA